MSEENTKTAILYGKSNCPNCAFAKNLLSKNNYEVKYINLDEENARKAFYDRVSKELQGPVMSVPQIWISNKYIGGYSDLVEYIKSEKEIVFNKDF
jgi:glutaredoxin